MTAAAASASDRRVLVFRALTLAAIVCMALAFFSPIWWVSLKAPQYPADTFPDGVRIHFHMDGVKNGCEIRSNQEVFEDEALDCVHEMNTINHYIGMEPIEKGAVIETMLAPYLFVGMGALLLVFMFYKGPYWWLLAIPAAALPVGFIVDYAAWLWYFGHNLSPMGAFTVKPFMPTVFGQGKVAQFATFSYPHYGFGLMLACSACLLLAMLIRHKQLKGVA